MLIVSHESKTGKLLQTIKEHFFIGSIKIESWQIVELLQPFLCLLHSQSKLPHEHTVCALKLLGSNSTATCSLGHNLQDI